MRTAIDTSLNRSTTRSQGLSSFHAGYTRIQRHQMKHGRLPRTDEALNPGKSFSSSTASHHTCTLITLFLNPRLVLALLDLQAPRNSWVNRKDDLMT